MIKNPIIPGFYPDPSICRVGEDFYIVNSSFSYFPGVPVFHSRDLANWRQIGHVLTRKSQLPLTYEMISGGIFAPSLRYSNGTFYLITTNMTMGCVNFIVTAANPSGPWSEMHIIEGADGIDPSLFFDEDGKCYYTGTSRFEAVTGEKQGIWCSELDVVNFRLVGDRHILSTGAQMDAASPEGPHIYKRDGYYYLMIAEGGTEHYHAVTISRSRGIFGPYENYQGNPILTHRHLGKSYPVCNVGHGDLVELPDSSWYMVMLGSRLTDGYHKILGRETFIAPVEWEDGWPVVSRGTGKIEDSYASPALMECVAGGEGSQIFEDFVMDHFDTENLSCEWNFLGTPYEDFIKIEKSCLHLKLLKNSMVPWELDHTDASIFSRMKNTGRTTECVSFVGRRQQHLDFDVIAKMIFVPDDGESAGLVVLQNDANQFRLEAVGKKNRQMEVRCIKTVSMIDRKGLQHFEEEILGAVPLENTRDTVTFKISGKGIYYSFYLENQDAEFEAVAENADGGFLGSESAGGFVGTYMGMFASGGGLKKEKYAQFDYFVYEKR